VTQSSSTRHSAIKSDDSSPTIHAFNKTSKIQCNRFVASSIYSLIREAAFMNVLMRRSQTC